MHSESFLSDMGPRTASDGERLSILSADPSVFVPLEIRLLSDADLIAATRPLRRGIAAYAWLVAPVVTVIAAYFLGAVAAVIACCLAIAGCKMAIYYHERSNAVARGKLAKREFCARYHIGALTLDETAAVSQMFEDTSIEAVMLFRAWALPHGGHRFIRIEFGPTARIAMYMTPFLGDLQIQDSAHARMAKLDLPLSPAHAQRLRASFEDITPGQLANVPQGPLEGVPMAGLPCDVVVLRRDQPTLRASMNFRGIATLHKLSPAERLVSEILEVEGELTGTERFEVDPLLRQAHADLIPGSI